MSRSIPKLVALIGAAALALGMTTACGGGKKPSAGGAAAGAVTMWGLTGGGEPTIKKSVEDWNKANPDKKIDVQFFGNDAFKEKIRTAVGAKNPPTLIYSWGGGTLQDYVKNGAVTDITASVGGVADKIAPGVVENGKVDGKLYALPANGTKAVVLYYNKEVFEKAGVQPPKTWDDVKKLIPVFRGKGIDPFSIGGQSKWPELMWISYLTDRKGGPDVFKKIVANEPNAWSDPAIKASLEEIQALTKEKAFPASFSSIATDNSADIALVTTGKAAMLVQGTWAYPQFMETDPEFVKAGKLGYVAFPTIADGKGDPTNIVGNPSNYWSVSAHADPKAQEIAQEYLKTQVMNDAYVDGLISEGLVPPVQGADAKLAKQENADYLKFAYGLVMNAPSFQLSWDQALSPAAGEALLTNLDQVFIGQKTPDQFIEAMNATIGK